MTCEHYQTCPVRNTLIKIEAEGHGDDFYLARDTIAMLKRNFCETGRESECPYHESQRQ